MEACPYHAPGSDAASAVEPRAGAAVHRLTCYRTIAQPPRLAPGRSARAWMDATPERYAYRCLPLSIANGMGWEILAPCRIEAEWNGGTETDDLAVEVEDPHRTRFALSHFGRGILTFSVGYLFRTEPGIGLWARGAPNLPKDGIAPLEGIVETDWLTFTFTMNWQLTRPGRVVFDPDEPICFITPIAYRALEQVVPEIVPIEANPELDAAFTAWKEARERFNAGLRAEEAEAVKQGWQKWYMRGETLAHERPNARHLSKLTLAEPVIRTAEDSRDLT